MEEDHDSDACPSLSENVQKHEESIKQCCSRKRESDQCPISPAIRRRCISNPRNTDAPEPLQKLKIVYNNLKDPSSLHEIICTDWEHRNMEEDHGSQEISSLSENVQKHEPIEQCCSRKRESTSSDQRASIRRCISNPTTFHDTETFRKLKTAYDNLKDPSLQRCFLYCALFVRKYGEDLEKYIAEVMKLVRHVVDAGIVARMNTWKEELGKARTMLDRLQAAGLLTITRDRFVEMTGVVRSMALGIMEEENNVRVMITTNGIPLKHLPDEESWTEDLVNVALQGSQIEEISPSFRPSCSKLAMLLLSHNFDLKRIGDSFFDLMPELKLLDLSATSIESLPSSVFRLVNLTTLVLSCCRELKRIPSVRNLRALKRLDLCFSGLEEVPRDIHMLSKLTYLDLSSTEVEEFKGGTLSQVLHLQFLRLPFSSPVAGSEFTCLSRLEKLTCSFYDAVDLDNYLLVLKYCEENESRPPPELHVQVGTHEERKDYSIFGSALAMFDDDVEFASDKDDPWSMVGFYNCDVNVNLQNYFQEVVIQKCSQARSLCSLGRSLNIYRQTKGVSKLKHISVMKCHGIEMLFSLSYTTSCLLKYFEYMDLYKLENLSVLFRKERDVPYGLSFSNLKRFVIQECPSIKLLFPFPVLRNLRNLKRLYVMNCAMMEEIFESEEEEDIMERKNLCVLPKLCAFRLEDLPELKRVCGGRKICCIPRSCSLIVEDCPKLPKASVYFYNQW